jgi:L-serine dehydratase
MRRTPSGLGSQLACRVEREEIPDVAQQRSVFDIIGPVMIGPSSSHTAGAVRLGGLARAIFGGQPDSADIVLHGSFASTGAGHGTDLALVAGLLGMSPDDPRIPEAFAEAEAAGLAVSFAAGDLGEVHPNTARLTLRGPDGREMLVEGCSVGGGDVLVTRIGEFEVAVSGELPVLVVAHHDQPGVIAGVSAVLAAEGVNVASMEVSRERRGAAALMIIETDNPVRGGSLDELRKVAGVTGVWTVPAV